MIKINKLTKSFGHLSIFADFQLSIHYSKIIALVGPSGCGKTTLLNILSGIETPDSGKIVYDSSFTGRIGYMMQDPLLLPWRTLSENAMLGYEMINDISRDQEHDLNYYFDVFDLSKSKLDYPSTSSGGMKQRVALIRTLLIRPLFLLLDEPFASLDFDIKLNIQRHLVRYYYKTKATILLVTHDIEDAIALADSVVVLSHKPASIKAEVSIDLGITKRDPVEARKSPKFREYFIQIWDELKYLNNNE